LGENVDYDYRMGRPPKKPGLRMDTDLRIPVTSEQKQLIGEALVDEPNGLAAWARGVLLKAAEDRIARRRSTESTRPPKKRGGAAASDA
jgi:hypothetical protein